MPIPRQTIQRERIRESRGSLASGSPLQMSPYSESPKFVNRETRFGGNSMDMTKSSRSGLGISRSQAKIERWSMNDKMRVLEEQVGDREEVFRENMELKERVRVTEQEHERLRERFSDMNSQVKALMQRDESIRSKSEADLAEAREKISALGYERDQTAHENSRLKRDLDLIQEELARVRELASETIDRKIHSRIVGDLKNENDKLRKCVEESVPRAVHERLVIQFEESSHTLIEKSRESVELQRELTRYCSRLKCAEDAESTSRNTISKLKDELIEADNSNDRFSRQLIELERMVASKNKSSNALNELEHMKSELAESQKRMNVLLSELSFKAANEKRLGLEASFLNQSMEIARSDKAKMLARLGAMKEESRILKLAIENDRSEFGESLKGGIAEIQNKFDSSIQQLIHGVWKLLTQFRLVDDSWEKPDRVTDLVVVLKAALTATTNELNRYKSDYEIASTELAKLVARCTEKDGHLRNLSSKLSVLEATRISEDLVMSKLRESIESAESRLTTRNRAPKIDSK